MIKNNSIIGKLDSYLDVAHEKSFISFNISELFTEKHFYILNTFSKFEHIQESFNFFSSTDDFYVNLEKCESCFLDDSDFDGVKTESLSFVNDFLVDCETFILQDFFSLYKIKLGTFYKKRIKLFLSKLATSIINEVWCNNLGEYNRVKELHNYLTEINPLNKSLIKND